MDSRLRWCGCSFSVFCHHYFSGKEDGMTDAVDHFRNNVWADADTSAIVAQAPMLLKRIMDVLRFHGEGRFIEAEPSSLLGALEVLKERHGE